MLIDPFILLLDSVLAETQYSDLITNDIWKNDNGANPLRALFYSIPAILSLIGKRCIDQENSAVVNLCVNCCACTAILYLVSVFSSGIYIGRLPVYTTLQGYAVMPWLINHMFTKQSAKIIAGGLVLGFVAFFYYKCILHGMHFDEETRMIRVLHVVTYMGRGGLESMIMNYYRRMDRKKIQFDFLVHRRERAEFDDEIENLGGKIYRLPPIDSVEQELFECS